MDISKIGYGKKAPEVVNAIIEVPMNSGPVKYEFDKDAGAIFVDRILQVAMEYPCNYGFIPHTLSGDGDPADVLVVANVPFVPGSVVACRPVGVLLMEDESGQDEKILAVCTKKADPYFENVEEYTDLPRILLEKIEHFFTRYKDLEKNKWVKILGYKGKNHAYKLVKEAIERA